MKSKHSILWSIIFLLIFLLSQDYLFIKWDNTPMIWGLPNWITWFAFVHLLFIAVFYWFAKKHWNE